MKRNNNDNNNLKQSEIEVARLAFLGAAIATLGDGLSTIAAGLALEALENPTETRSQNQKVQMETTQTQKQLDYYINELIKIRKKIR